MILKGGKEAEHSCAVLHAIVQECIESATGGAASGNAVGLATSRADVKVRFSDGVTFGGRRW